MRNVAIVGVSQIPHTEATLDKSIFEMDYELTKGLIDKVGISKDDIETVIEASSDYWRGIACSNIHTLESTTGYLKEVSKVEQDGAFGFLYAYMRILSGQFDTALVVSDTKCSEIDMPFSNITNISADPIFQRWIGIDEISSAAIQAQDYMQRYGISEEQIAKVSVKNLKNALNNPYAHKKGRIKVDDVLRSPMLSYPLRELNCCPYSDGACAIILASEEKAKKITDNPAWIRGVGWGMDSYFMGDRDLVDTTVLKTASRRAYKMAGIEDPRRELDLIELSEPFAPQELLWYEGLGICKEGKGGTLMDEGTTEMEGNIPVNPSGGVLSFNPYVARGLIRIAESAMQVMDNAGEHQIPDAETALAHAIGGFAGEAHAVICLSK
jgi:Acetyl-CoA acetyltransferase